MARHEIMSCRHPGSEDERKLATELAGPAGIPASDVLAGWTGLLGLAALIADARLVVTGDTGAAHLAYAYPAAFRNSRTPCFGDVARTTPSLLAARPQRSPSLPYGAATATPSLLVIPQQARIVSAVCRARPGQC